MAEQNMRLDADEQVFFDNQLALVKSRTYDVEHKALKALKVSKVIKVKMLIHIYLKLENFIGMKQPKTHSLLVIF